MRRGSGLLIGLFSWALAGCDPTSGFADTADAALPKIKRYFDGRGSRLAEGPWHRVFVDLDPETLYHVGARRLDDAEPTFHLFGRDVREGCAVSPNVGTWFVGKPQSAPFRVLPFLEDADERGRGRLRFTTLDCQVQDIAVEDAGRPYPRLYDNGYLVPRGAGFTFVDPWRGEQREIAVDLRSALVWESVILMWDDGQLKSYSAQFEEGDVFGSNVTSVISFGGAYLVEDEGGLHRVTFDRQRLTLESEPVLAGACGLQTWPSFSRSEQGAWVSLQLPCGSARPSLVALDGDYAMVGDALELPVETDSRFVRVFASPVGNAGPEPIAALYLTDVESNVGTLWAWRTGSDAPVLLAERARLNVWELTSSQWDGVSYANFQSLGGVEVFDWVLFRWNGETQLLAERIVQSSASGETLVNFDGVSGDLALIADDDVQILAEGLPSNTREAISYVGAHHYARVDHFDGTSGRLVMSQDSSEPRLWEELARGVAPENVRFSWFMPAVIFLEGWDAERGTGALIAYNYELDARVTLAEGVSSFDLTSYPWDGVIYSVPHGRDRGIWFSKAK